MKYIILPTLKLIGFILRLFIVIPFATIYYFIPYILYIIWNFKIPKWEIITSNNGIESLVVKRYDKTIKETYHRLLFGSIFGYTYEEYLYRNFK